jgi:hypothetical protein
VGNTLVDTREEPSQKALFVAGIVVAAGTAYVLTKNRNAVLRAVVSAASPALVRPLAILLTRGGLL